jgi:hypothetical protein
VPSAVKQRYLNVASNRRIWGSDQLDKSENPRCVMGQIRPNEEGNAKERDTYSQGGRIQELRNSENKAETNSDNHPPNYSGSQVEYLIEFTLAADGPADEPNVQNRSRWSDPT